MSALLPPDALRLLWELEPVGLPELEAQAALRIRMDRKYLVDWATFLEVASQLRTTHRVLEIDGQRAFHYDTVYFDSPTLGAYRAHVQQRRRRYKARTRRYVDSGLQRFEVKLKGRRGETIKHQLDHDAAPHGVLTDAARAFLIDRVTDAYPGLDVPELAATIRTDYHRFTLAADGSRVTCDFALSFSDGGPLRPALDAGHVIVETKSARRTGAADRLLRSRGLRPLSVSKYCVGVGLLRDEVRANDLRWLMTRYFDGDPARA